MLERIMQFLNGEMTRPVPFQSFSESWFHYLALSVAIAASVIAALSLRKGGEAKLRRFLLGFAFLLLAFEGYKQLIFSYQADWHYQWYAFPFQFCSTPMYVALLAGLTKNGRLRQALVDFLGTYGLFAGLAVMLYPNDVFINTIGINIQTMVHHGAMMVVGIALLANKVKLTSKSILGATAVFIVLVSTAILMNAAYNAWLGDQTFNMFFINPVYGTHLPILSQIAPLVPHPVFVVIYIVGFALVAYLMLLIGIGFATLSLATRKHSVTAH